MEVRIIARKRPTARDLRGQITTGIRLLGAGWAACLGIAAIACWNENPVGSGEYTAHPVSRGPGAACNDVRFPYPEPALECDRSVGVVVEIDWVDSVPMPATSARIDDRPISLESIFADLGFEATVLHSDAIPADSWPGTRWPEDPQVRRLVEQHRNVVASPDDWAFYLLFAPRDPSGLEYSGVIDPPQRTAALVTVDPTGTNMLEALHAAAHEIGHLMNLPHPWDVYGDTRSLMSYPWRWRDWNWYAPEVFRFDDAGRRHILRAPEACVRPGFDDPRCRFGETVNQHD